MILSLKWLSDFIDVNDYLNKPEALAEILTRAGLEVENVTQKAKDFSYVVTGYILEKDKHPNADKLSLCKVTTGEGVVHQIVCGAQNHKTHDKVVVALPGAVLPGNFVIKHSTIRGVESGGMLCSNKELGLEGESEGILILPEAAPIGKSFADYMGFDDVTFELKVTPNRADCLSHYGLAREISCLLNRPLKKIEIQFKPIEKSTKDMIQVEVKNEDLCPRYAGRFIENVTVKESPDWLKKRIQTVGLNSINNIVDVTNYIMIELGQPLHAFDADKISGHKIIVEKSNPNEKFITLDGSEKKLTGEELMIRDAEKSVAIAGVVGGQNSGVSDTTTKIFLEAAFFNPSVVRKSSRQHGITTDSGYRFSRGVDPNLTTFCMDRAVDLILKVGGGVAYDHAWDLYPNPIRKNSISVSVETISNRLGYTAEADTLKNFLIRLGCKIEEVAVGTYSVLPPTYRFDIEHEMDLVEEYARLHGYENIPESIPAFHQIPAKQDFEYMMNHKVALILKEKGFKQALNFAFTSEKEEKKFLGFGSALTDLGFKGMDQSIKLLNPLSDDLNAMRTILSHKLYANMIYNFHQGNECGKLFEIGKTFYVEDSEYKESLKLSSVCWGKSEGFWQKDHTHNIIFELKSALENLFAILNIKSYQFSDFTEGKIPSFLHLGQNAAISVEGKKIGFIGSLHPRFLEEDKIRVPAAVFEIDLDLVYKGQPRASKFDSISKLPAVQRDLALVMSSRFKAGDLNKEILKLGSPLVKGVEIVDLYQGDRLDKGLKSITYRIKLQDKNATLQDEVVNKAIETILNGLKEKFSIQLR